ncbi:MAG: LysR family transcriptional regulator [Pseudomonadota bacterium]
MNISQMSAFQAVMTSASLSDAAKKLGRTQPAVSAAIKTLEEQLGLQLFQREGRKLIPVPEAHYLLTETSAILGQMTRVRQTMKSLADGQSGALQFAAMPGPVSMLFPRFIASQIAAASDTSVSILARSSNQIAELARAQNIDFGFADAPGNHDGENLYKAQIISAKCFVALPSDHPLTQNNEVAICDLDAVPMGSLQATHAHQKNIENIYQEQGCDFALMVESQTFLPILQFVGAGQCCSIVDPLTAVHVNSVSDLSQVVTILPLKEELRYRYAIFEPRYRPLSVLAEKIKQAWRAEVLDVLEKVQSSPQIESGEPSMSVRMSL